MAITRYVGDRFAGLNTDTKPTNVILGAEFIETDTGAIYVYDGSSWVVAPNVANLGDTSITTLTSGDFLSYNGTNWVNGALVLADISDLGDLAADDLADVTITTPTEDQVLAYNDVTSQWENVDLSTIVSDVSTLNDLSDVTVAATPTTADVLRYDGAEWVNAALEAADIQSGTFADARIAESNVTQHEAALSITLSQVTDSGAAAALGVTGSDLNVVTGTFGTNGQLLQWNTDGDAVDSGILASDVLTDITAESIADLSDVTVTTVDDNQILQYNSTDSVWENVTPDFASATDATITGDGTTASPLSANINDAGTETDDLFSASKIVTDFQALSEKNSAGGYVGLNGSTKIDAVYLPALAITEVFPVADITARDALTIGTADGEVQEGDVAVVLDASADADVPSGSASYIWDGAEWQLMGTPDIQAAGIDTQIQFNDNGSFGANANFTFDDASDLLNVTGNIQVTEGTEPTTPSGNDAAVYFVETTATESFVKVRLGNGDDAIVASYTFT